MSYATHCGSQLRAGTGVHRNLQAGLLRVGVAAVLLLELSIRYAGTWPRHSYMAVFPAELALAVDLEPLIRAMHLTEPARPDPHVEDCHGGFHVSGSSRFAGARRASEQPHTSGRAEPRAAAAGRRALPRTRDPAPPPTARPYPPPNSTVARVPSLAYASPLGAARPTRVPCCIHSVAFRAVLVGVLLDGASSSSIRSQ